VGSISGDNFVKLHRDSGRGFFKMYREDPRQHAGAATRRISQILTSALFRKP
jgi:hypothetical protein